MKFTNAGMTAHTFKLGDLKVGDCFMYDERIGMVVSRNGHDYPLDLATGKEFYAFKFTMLAPSTDVYKLKTELMYTIML